jgi:hypothetical protein
VADGNFKADHIKQKHADVWLTNGEGFMTGIASYEDYESKAVERTQVNPSSKQMNCTH